MNRSDTDPHQPDQRTNDESVARREAQRQWEANPFAAETVVNKEKESLDWFREARRIRYHEYAPWLIGATGIRQIREKKILEIGVGLGSDHYSLATGGNEMYALDLSGEHLRLTQRHLSLEGLSTNPHHGDMENMPFADNTFDVVYSFGVLHHTDHMDKAVAEIRRVLKREGTAIISVYHRDSVFFWWSTFLKAGILKGQFFRYGWKRTLARIESGAGDDFVPTVNVLTRASLRRLFCEFSILSIETNHAELTPMMISTLSRFGANAPEKLMRWAGWYLTIKAQK
jgi:SAM-dependent methyltransferase